MKPYNKMPKEEWTNDEWDKDKAKEALHKLIHEHTTLTDYKIEFKDVKTSMIQTKYIFEVTDNIENKSYLIAVGEYEIRFNEDFKARLNLFQTLWN